MNPLLAAPKTTPIVWSVRDFDAALFDLDGVISKTALVHAAVWKELFDGYFACKNRQSHHHYPMFDSETDYRELVDGKPRYDGVASVLQSRDISLPWGTPDDSPEAETVCGLGNRKNRLFNAYLENHGVKPYDDTLALIRHLREQGMKVGVFSASKNCAAVLESLGILDWFDVRVDGVEAEDRGLAGKPKPDMLLDTASQLGVAPERTVVFEDAIAGVQAARSGGFSLVVGVDRNNQRDRLLQHGADLVLDDLSQFTLREPQANQPEAHHPDYQTERATDWQWRYEQFEPEHQGSRESLFALGNGYLTTRGAFPESRDDGVHYPGTYIAGCYNRLKTTIENRTIENEDLVNIPNWLSMNFSMNGGEWFNCQNVTILDYQHGIDIQQGFGFRRIRFQDKYGHITTLEERRFVHILRYHLAGLEWRITPENWSGSLMIRSALDGQVMNNGVKRYQPLSKHHLESIEQNAEDTGVLFLRTRTSQSRIELCLAARHRIYLDNHRCNALMIPEIKPGYAAFHTSVDVVKGNTLIVEKIATVFTSRDVAVSEPGLEAKHWINRASGFNQLLSGHSRSWRQLWESLDIRMLVRPQALDTDPTPILRLHLFHLLQTVSPNYLDFDTGVPARGWTGEAYRGHIFWDELFIFPFLNFRLPQVTRDLLRYRYRRLDEARANARQHGYKGALFPWQSGSNGREETPAEYYNPRSGRWMTDNTHLQFHINGAIAYNIWQHFQITGDVEFLSTFGAEMLFEIARFWACLAQYDSQADRYDLNGVMGPDEYHDRFPANAQHPGLNNNSYTNLMAVWVLCRALDTLALLPSNTRHYLCEELEITADEIQYWEHVSRRMRLVFVAPGILSQFEGYEQLLPFPKADYQARYGNLYRLDLILESENRSVNEFQVAKQADVLMLYYLFSTEELRDLSGRLGYEFDASDIPRTIEYYLERTCHSSSLSQVVHAWVLARTDRLGSWDLFRQVLYQDISDIQGGTTREGIHMGAMAGSVDILQRCYTGMSIRDGVLWLNPLLPDALESVAFRLHYRQCELALTISHQSLHIRICPNAPASLKLGLLDQMLTLSPGEERLFFLSEHNESTKPKLDAKHLLS